ncbi:MAG TPA: ankyrin repeat domain-containing protein [Stellaceae bacterium]|nr:ankyrin repeat domain-containing protein [Stellaceae bacterium]
MIPVLLRVLFVFLAIGLVPKGAAAQTTPPTPFTGIPKVPRTLPLIYAPNNDGRVAAAAAAGDADDVASLIANGGSPDDSDRQGHTALMHAAMSNRAVIADILLMHAAKVEIRDDLGDTALHWAAQTGSVAVIRLLIAFHAEVNQQDARGMTPLMLAASNNRTDAVRVLLQSHADPSKTDYTGQDALGWAGSHAVIVSLLKAAEH